MVILEVAPNPNCDPIERVFHDLAPARRISRVRLARGADEARWCAVTGWTASGVPCPAVMQKVDDSGEGVAFLIYGGEAGLRLKPAGLSAPWGLDDAEQWGEPFLLVADLRDVRLDACSRRRVTHG